MPSFARRRLAAFLLVATGLAHSAVTSSVTDIAGWNHPTKKVLQAYGIGIRRVDLVDKVTPHFHVAMPSTAAACDAAGRDDILRELAAANAYWSFRVVDSTRAGKSYEAFATCDPKTKTVTGIRVVRAPTCAGASPYKRVLATAGGTLEVRDVSPSADVNRYAVAIAGATIRGGVQRLDEGEYALYALKDATPAGSAARYLLMSFTGPGMNCHDRHRMVRFDAKAGTMDVSPSFGACAEFASARMARDTLVVRLESELDGGSGRTARWVVGGRWIGD